MDSRILQLIESANPQDRKKAIQMLAKMGGPEAIRTLGMIYKQETDPELKELAVSAGKYIKKQQTGENAAPPMPVRAPIVESYEEDDEPEQDEEVEEEYIPVVVSAAKQSQAKGLMDRALDLSMHGEKDKAIESISKAFKLNPNLREDTYYMGVAMDITGMDQNSTIRLVNEDEKSRKVKNKEKLKNDGSGGSEEIGWDTALIDLATYYAVIAGIAIIGMVMIVQAITNGFATISTNCEGCTPQQIRDVNLMVQNFRSLTGIGVAASVIYGLIVAAINIVVLLIYYAFMHVIATMLMGGDGTYRGLIHRGSLPLVVSYAITGVIGLITIYVSVRELFDPEMIRQMNQPSTTSSMSSTLISVLGLVSTIASIGGSIWFIGRVAQNYEFSWSRGCWTNIITNVVIFVMACGCYMMVLNSLIASFMKTGLTPMP